MIVNTLDALIGRTFTAVTRPDPDELHFAAGREVWALAHTQDCCESVELVDVVGDLDDLVGSPIVLAEEVSVLAEEVSTRDEAPPEGRDPESYTWTFYRIATVKGTVTLRWFGESNGYYSEGVDLVRVAP